MPAIRRNEIPSSNSEVNIAEDELSFWSRHDGRPAIPRGASPTVLRAPGSLQTLCDLVYPSMLVAVEVALAGPLAQAESRLLPPIRRDSRSFPSTGSCDGQLISSLGRRTPDQMLSVRIPAMCPPDRLDRDERPKQRPKAQELSNNDLLLY